jgi:hypothetical protein
VRAVRHIARFLPASLLLAMCSPVWACHGHASSDDCAKVREHYVALVSSADPALAGMTQEQRDVAREMTMELRKGDPTWQRVSRSCESSVTPAEAECALDAKSADAWETCFEHADAAKK